MKEKIKPLKPLPMWETKIKRRYDKKRKVSNRSNIDRPPAKYDNVSREEHISRILNLKL